MMDIDKIIQGIDQLKPVPQVANKVLALARNPKSSMADLAEVIVYDQALTANLLRVCNSAYFSLPVKVNSIQQALMYLGMDQLVNLVVMNSGSEDMKSKQEGYDLEAGELWKYSVSSALIAQELAEKKGVKNTQMIFTAALLKDIGKVVLNQYVAKLFEKINFLVSKHQMGFREAEKAVIGIDHAELGGLVAAKWQFSQEMVDIIRNHHMPEDPAKYNFETQIVYLADTICMMMGIGVGSDGLSYHFHREIFKKQGFTDRDIQEIIANFGDKYREVEELINLAK